MLIRRRNCTRRLSASSSASDKLLCRTSPGTVKQERVHVDEKVAGLLDNLSVCFERYALD